MVRFKQRYLLGEVLGETGQAGESGLNANVLKQQVLLRAIRESIELNYGDEGVGLTQSSLAVKYLNSRTGLFIVRAARDHFRIVWGAITFVTKLQTSSCILTILHVGGTIRSCQKTALDHSRVQLKLLHITGATSEDVQTQLSELAELINQEADEMADEMAT